MPSFNRYYALAAAAGINWVSATVKVALLTSSWTPDRTLNYYNQLTNELASGDGYTTGGATIGSKAVNTVSNEIFLDAADPTWTFAATKAFRYAVVYIDTGDGSTSSLLWYIDLGALSLSGSYTIQWNASGVLKFSDAA